MTIIRTTILIWMGILTCFGNVSSQALGVDLLSNGKNAKIDFQFVQGFIVVDLYYQKSLPLKFIFDTGAQHTILFEKVIADSFFPNYSKKINLVGADVSSQLNAYVLRNTSLQLKGCETVKRDILVLEEDFVKISELIGMNIHGIIGGDFFRNLVLEIDYAKNKITLNNADKFDFSQLTGYSKMPIDVKGSKPYVHASINLTGSEKVEGVLLIDTGAALTTMIQTNSHPSLVMPEKTIKSNLGHGLGGVIEGYVGKIAHMEVDRFEFVNFISYFQDTENFIEDDEALDRNGVIGNYVLQRFKLVIDYARSYLYLKPTKDFHKEFKYDRSGLTVYAYGEKLDHFVIRNVIKGSPADELGLQVNDEIVKIGWLPARYYTLDHLTQRLSGKVGNKVKLKIKRGDTTFKAVIALRDLI